MATIDDERFGGGVDTAGPTVREVHEAVRVARLSHCRHGRARVVRRGRVRRRPISEYRPAAVVDTATDPPVVRTAMPRNRRHGPAAVALSLLYVGFIRVFEPGLNHRILVIGVCLIAVAAAVSLNAFTLAAVSESARNSERAVLRGHQ